MSRKLFLFLVLQPGDGFWGEWTPWSSCPPSTYATAFKYRMEGDQGDHVDDTALNSISLKCENKNGTQSR